MKQPQIYKAYKKLINESPKLLVRPLDVADKEDRKKAKLMEKMLNYAFEHNTNGMRSRYYRVMKYVADQWMKQEMLGIKVSWDSVQKNIDLIIKQNIKP